MKLAMKKHICRQQQHHPRSWIARSSTCLSAVDRFKRVEPNPDAEVAASSSSAARPPGCKRSKHENSQDSSGSELIPRSYHRVTVNSPSRHAQGNGQSILYKCHGNCYACACVKRKVSSRWLSDDLTYSLLAFKFVVTCDLPSPLDGVFLTTSAPPYFCTKHSLFAYHSYSNTQLNQELTTSQAYYKQHGYFPRRSLGQHFHPGHNPHPTHRNECFFRCTTVLTPGTTTGDLQHPLPDLISTVCRVVVCYKLVRARITNRACKGCCAGTARWTGEVAGAW